MDYNKRKTSFGDILMNERNDYQKVSKLSQSLCILQGLFRDEAFSAFALWREDYENIAKRMQFLRALYACGAQDDFLGYLSQLIVTDDNPFSRACAHSNEISQHLFFGFCQDMDFIGKLISTTPCNGFSWGSLRAPLYGFDQAAAIKLKDYYLANGYGEFLAYTAFRFADGVLTPIKTPSDVRLTDLKGFEREQAEVKDNFENFVHGLAFSDMLLYGDRGTGKSSTVHAMVNEFATRKLRLVELNKEELLSLPRLKTHLARVPMKFIVFIDDFSLSESDERFSTLKASLQGSMEGNADNVMIVATSNRRHIVEENFDTRNNSVHAGDSEQELLSLADRFGITVLFSGVGKKEYLFIVRELARDAHLTTEMEKIECLAERWAIQKGGRSPRRAKQFIGYASACESKGKEIEF